MPQRKKTLKSSGYHLIFTYNKHIIHEAYELGGRDLFLLGCSFFFNQKILELYTGKFASSFGI